MTKVGFLAYDETIKVGDLITSYTKGFSEVTTITPRPNACPLFEYIQRFTFEGKPIKGNRVRTCDASYCRKASEIIPKMIENKKNEIEVLGDILKTL